MGQARDQWQDGLHGKHAMSEGNVDKSLSDLQGYMGATPVTHFSSPEYVAI